MQIAAFRFFSDARFDCSIRDFQIPLVQMINVYISPRYAD